MHSVPSELWLCLDLSSAFGSVALFRAEETLPPCLVDEVLISLDGNHLENLVPKLTATLSAHGLKLNAVDRFITLTGPGSFTGLRIAMASLKAFAITGQKPIDTLSGSEARALAWLSRVEGGAPPAQIVVLTHGSMQKFVRSTYRVSGGSVLLEEEVLASVEEILRPSESERVILCDERAWEVLPKNAGQHFPLRASHLGETLRKAQGRQTHANIAQWVALVPRYYGERFS